MAVITSLATLETAVGDYLARSILTTFIPNFVQNAEGKIYRTLRLLDMETAFTGTITSGVIALPTRYVALKHAYVDQANVQLLDRVSAEVIYRAHPVRSNSGIPTMISEEAGSFIFGAAGEGRTITGTYYKYYEPLRTTDPNWVVTNVPHVLLYGALLESAPFIQDDPRLATWQRLFDESIALLSKEVGSEKRSGSALRALPG